jgi:hypothetical protein
MERRGIRREQWRRNNRSRNMIHRLGLPALLKREVSGLRAARV